MLACNTALKALDEVIDLFVSQMSDVTDAEILGVRGTPGFFLNGLFFSGVRSYEAFQQIIEREMETAMGLAGVTNIDQLSPEYVKEAKSVVSPHEMSAFTHLPGQRLV